MFFLSFFKYFGKPDFFDFTFWHQFNASQLGWKSTIFIRFACCIYWARKSCKQIIYCKTFSCPKKHNYMKIGLTLLFIVWSNINMFTLARLWYLDCQTTFLYCQFFNGIPLGLQDQYLTVRIRYEPQNSILRSSHAKYTFLVRCVARWNHSTCFDAEIVSTWQRISHHLRSLRV